MCVKIILIDFCLSFYEELPVFGVLSTTNSLALCLREPQAAGYIFTTIANR